MKKVLQFIAVFILVTSTATAQWVVDSVSMGPGYSNNIFYALGNGTQKVEPGNNWHLAFSMNGSDSASVFANQTGSSTNFFTRVYDVNRPIADWANVSYSDTLTGTLLYNGEKGWYQGALNDVPSASILDFGWGEYDQTSHLFAGTRLFIIKAGSNFYKLAIDSLNPFTYTWNFRLETLAPTLPPSASYTISKASGYNDRLFAYFNIDSGVAYDREPNINNWDFQFIGYPSYIPSGPTTFDWRVVTGVLNNRGLPVAQAQMIDVDDAMTAFQTAPGASWMTGWESNPYTTIGYDWKTFDLGSFQYVIPDSNSYFVSAKNDSVYQLQFLSFGGSANGNIKFRYRNLGTSPLAVADYQLFGQGQLYPNPTSTNTNFLFNAKAATEARLNITAINGQVLVNQIRKVSAGLNAWEINTSNLPIGNYLISVQSAGGMMYKKMTVSR